MVKKYRFILISLLFLLAGLYSCRKTTDKISLSRWQPGVTLPFIQTELRLSDIIPQDTSLMTAPDSSLYYAYHQDSVFVFSADSLLHLPEEVLDTSYRFTLGAIAIDTFNISATFAMSDALPYLDPAVRDTLLAHDQTQNIFPPFAFNSSFDIVTEPIDIFQYLTFSKGYIAIEVHNQLPVVLQNVVFSVNDQVNGVVLKNITIPQLQTNEIHYDTIFLYGLTLGNRLSFTVTNFSSGGSYPDSVFIDLTRGLGFYANAKELEVVNGKARIPQQIMFSDTKTIDFTFSEDVRLYYVLFSQGELNYRFNSHLPVRVYIELKLPTGLVNGVIPHADIVLSSMGISEGAISFEGVELNMNTDSTQPFSRFPVYTGIVIMPTNELVEFDSSDVVLADFTSTDVKPGFAEGYFGKRNVDLETGNIALDLTFLQGIQGEIYLDNPVMKLTYGNSFGLPVKLKPQFTAINGSTGQEVDLSLDSIALAFPEINTGWASGNVTLDKTNSQIVDFMAIRPDTVSYSGGGLINWNTDTMNFIYDTSSIVAGINLQIPMVFSADSLRLSDTVQINAMAEPVPLKETALKVNLENGFPFDMDLMLQLRDSVSGQVFNTLDLGKINAAPVDASGRVTHPVRDSLLINLDESFFGAMHQANSGVFKAVTSTFSNGDVPVGLYSDYKIKITIGFTAVVIP